MQARGQTGRPAIEPVVWHPPPARERAPGALAKSYQLRVIPVPGVGPEDVLLDQTGAIVTGLQDGRILRISEDGGTIKTLANTHGRPLGLEWLPDGRLLVCDARRGLLALEPQSGRLSPLLSTVHGTALGFCNNAAVARDGTIYFSDSSRCVGIDHWQGELMAHSGSGRLFRLTPAGEPELLLDGLQFANGVALASDESFVCVAETGAYRVQRYWLSGPRAGSSEVLIDRLGGFPDNMSTGSDGLIWIALASPRNKLLDFLHPRAPLWRKLAWALPDALQPKPVRVVWLLAVDAQGQVMHDVSYPGHSYHMVTGVREAEGVLYLGSLVESAVAILKRE